MGYQWCDCEEHEQLHEGCDNKCHLIAVRMWNADRYVGIRHISERMYNRLTDNHVPEVTVELA